MNEAKQKNGILEGVIWKQLLLFFFPIMAGSFFQQMYNTVDSIILGQMVGKNALAAVGGSASLIVGLIVNFFLGLTSGAGVVISQLLGAGKKQAMNDAIHTIYAFAAIGSIVFMIAGLILSPQLLGWMNTSPELLEDSKVYLEIYFAGIFFVFIYNTGSGILRALGDSKRPFYYLVACCLLNVVLDIIMVVVFRLGVAGVAIATVAAQAVSAVLVTRALLKERELCQFFLRKIRINKKILKSELYYGLPTGIQYSMYNISNMIIQTAINGFGTDTTAAWAAYGKLDAIYWMVSGALGIAITTFVGQNYGAGRMDRVKKSVSVCVGMDVVITIGMAAFLIVFRMPLFSIFSGDAAVVEIGARMLYVIAPFYICYVFTEILSGALRGMGDVIVPMAITMSCTCILRSIWVFTVAKAYPRLEVLVFNYPLTWTISAVLFVGYYIYLMRKKEKSGRNGKKGSISGC